MRTPDLDFNISQTQLSAQHHWILYYAFFLTITINLLFAGYNLWNYYDGSICFITILGATLSPQS